MRILMWLSIGFASACALGVWLLPDSWIIPCALCSLIPGLLCLIGKRWRRFACLLLGCGLGFVWFWLYQQFLLLPVKDLDGQSMDVFVTATDYSYETAAGAGFDARMEVDGKTYAVRVYLDENLLIRPGDTVTGEFRIRVTTPGAVNASSNHQGEGIFLIAYQAGDVAVTDGDGSGFYPAVLRRQIRDILHTYFPEDVTAFIQALLLGDTAELSYEIDTAFRISGIRHIIAVSGLHVSILYGLISTLTFKRRYLTAAASLPVLLLFAAVAGFTPSVTRACIMVGLMVVAKALDKEYDSPTALSFACLVMLLHNPLVITSVSFQLSVGCVAGILLFQQRIRQWIIGKLGGAKGKGLRPGLKRWFASSVSVTLGAMSLTTPLCAWYFGTVSLIGIVTNLLTLWVVNLVFYGIILVCVLAFLPENLAALLAWCLAWPTRYVLLTAKLLSKVPLAAVYTQSDYIVIWLIFVYILLAVFLLSKHKRPLQLICCGCLGLCLALLASWAEPLLDDCRVMVLDVGQGQSILLQSEGRTFLLDCGGDDDEKTADIIAETLLSQGIHRLDGIILTHTDRDHAGALEYLLTRMDTDVLILPGTVAREEWEALGSEILYVTEDLRLNYGNTEIQIFAPLFVDESNENSLCVLFGTEKCDILVTGDRSGFGERMLLRRAVLPDVDVLIAGHHGAATSTCDELLQAVKPETVMISVGENFYGHPSPVLLARLEQYGCTVYRTDLNGTILYRR